MPANKDPQMRKIAWLIRTQGEQPRQVTDDVRVPGYYPAYGDKLIRFTGSLFVVAQNGDLQLMMDTTR